MNATVLDTLRCAQTLRTAGFPEEQAEAMAQVLGDALTDVATKTDLDDLETRLNTKIDNAVETLDAKIDNRFETLDAKIDNAFGTLDAKIDKDVGILDAKLVAVNQRLNSLETSMQNQFVTVQKQIESLSDQFKHHTRVTYGMMGILMALMTLVIGSLLAPNLHWGTPTTTPPNPPTAEAHSPPPQTNTEAQPLVAPTETPTPAPST